MEKQYEGWEAGWNELYEANEYTQDLGAGYQARVYGNEHVGWYWVIEVNDGQGYWYKEDVSNRSYSLIEGAMAMALVEFEKQFNNFEYTF